MKPMNHVFPDPIRKLPQADIPLDGAIAYLSQAGGHQILFMEFQKDAVLPEHAHAAQAGIVVRGRIELRIGGEKKCFAKGDMYHIPADVKHSAQIYAGYADVTFFDEPNRYKTK